MIFQTIFIPKDLYLHLVTIDSMHSRASSITENSAVQIEGFTGSQLEHVMSLVNTAQSTPVSTLTHQCTVYLNRIVMVF